MLVIAVNIHRLPLWRYLYVVFFEELGPMRGSVKSRLQGGCSMYSDSASARNDVHAFIHRPRNRRHPPPPPVDEAPSRSEVDEPATRRRLRFVPLPPLRPLSRRLNAFCSIASTIFWQSF